ncbi:MAG: 23S rRNA (pseudouridine(1915)-N(3))-methyltransferase RlmH [Lachnospiraceae bacterium]|nr:23S rRNA (pseudouridine(1915)-N(3))-methyltransferase RlmH [Lachnospiraceae bacterium]
MKIDIICVGKIKEKFFTDAIGEYSKRLSRYCDLDIVQVKDEHAPESLSDEQMKQILKLEGERILLKIPQRTYLIALDIDGKEMSSEAMSEKLSDLMVSEQGRFTFVIGGSLGLWDEIKKKADLRLSFSKMTFPHQLMRVILLEQIYRCFRIMNHEPYHK